MIIALMQNFKLGMEHCSNDLESAWYDVDAGLNQYRVTFSALAVVPTSYSTWNQDILCFPDTFQGVIWIHCKDLNRSK